MGNNNTNSNAITLLKLNLMVKESLRSSFSSRLWVVAEIGQMNIASTGHCYLELIERNETTQYLAAKCSATIWRGALNPILRHFHSATGRELNVGMKILAFAEISYHELYGISLNISDIDPSFTLGELEMQRRATIKRLTDDGDMDRNSQLPLAELPKRIAVVSSSKAAGYGDFMNEILNNEYGYSFTIELFQATMQGNDAESSIISALKDIYKRFEEFDAIVIIRGGGSSSDLSCFDSYSLARMVAYAPISVISGIGHDRDESIVDMTAAISVKTPTAAARLLIDKFLEYETYLNDLKNYLKEIYREEVKCREQHIKESSHMLYSIVTNMVRDSSIYFTKAEQRVQFLTKNIISNSKKEKEREINELKNSYLTLTFNKNGVLERLHNSIKSRSEYIILNNNKILEVQKSRVESFDPKHIFALGYSLVRSKGQALKSTKEVEKGQNITINLSDGKLDAIITDITNG